MFCTGSLWVLQLPQSKDMPVMLSGDSELPMGVKMSVSIHQPCDELATPRLTQCQLG